MMCECRGKSEYLTMERISERNFSISKACDPDFASLIEELLQKDPSSRIGFKDIKDIQEHAAFSGKLLRLFGFASV
jgi:hypothetical protein